MLNTGQLYNTATLCIVYIIVVILSSIACPASCLRTYQNPCSGTTVAPARTHVDIAAASSRAPAYSTTSERSDGKHDEAGIRTSAG